MGTQSTPFEVNSRTEMIQQVQAEANALRSSLDQLRPDQIGILWQKLLPCIEQNPFDDALQPVLMCLTELSAGGPLQAAEDAPANVLAQPWQKYRREAFLRLIKLPETGVVDDALLFAQNARNSYIKAQFVLATDVDWYRGDSYTTSGAQCFEDYTTMSSTSVNQSGAVISFSWTEKRVIRDEEDGNFDKTYLSHWVGVYRVKGYLFRMLKRS